MILSQLNVSYSHGFLSLSINQIWSWLWRIILWIKGLNEYSTGKRILNPLRPEHFLKINKNLMKKKEANLLTFCTYGTFLAPVSSKFNGESNAHTHLVCRWRESSTNRDFSRNGKIFLKSRRQQSSIKKLIIFLYCIVLKCYVA